MMKKERKLTIVKKGDFLGIKCDFYKDEDNNIYMTRDQIGEALEYSKPNNSIRVMHNRKSNKERLDMFSTSIATIQVEGTRQVSRDITYYSEKGIYEICRISRQPVANDFQDWVYKQIRSIRKDAGLVEKGREEEFVDSYFSSLSDNLKESILEELLKKVENKQEEIDKMKPMLNDWNAFLDSEGNFDMIEVAKVLNIENVGRNTLYKILRDKRVLRKNNEPYQKFIKDGYFKVIIKVDNNISQTQTVVTSRGISWINNQMIEWQYA